MRQLIIAIVVATIALAAFLMFSNSTGLDSEQESFTYQEQFRSGTKIFYCAESPQTGCKLYADDLSGTAHVRLDITMAYGSEGAGLLLSPDGKNVAVILERKIILIDANTLVQRTLAQASADSEYGVYDTSPAFIPQARWINSSELEVSRFLAETTQPKLDEKSPNLIETKIIKI